MTQQTEGRSGLSAPVAPGEGGAKIKLVTVHGTGAGDITATGDRWWQFGSKFLTELTARIDLDPSRVEVVPFQWDEGPNSEAKRRKAGDRLYEQLKSYDDAGDEYYVIGHSHGGSVAYNALLKSISKSRPLKGLKCWCTVGTPFLDYRANRFMFQRIKSFGLSLYSSGMISFIIGASIWFKFYGVPETEDGLQNLLRAFGDALILYGLLCVGGLYLYERFRRSWYTKGQKRRASKHYSKIWLGFWHIEDEAISALTNIKHVSGPIIPSNFLKPLVSILQFMLVVVPGLIYAIDVFFDDGILLMESTLFFIDTAFDEQPRLGFLVELTSATAVQILVFLIFVWILTLILNVFAYIVGYPLSKMINGLVWTSVRQRAWGDDLLKEDVKAIGSHPPEFLDQYGPLPDSVSEPLRGHSEKHAILTLHKVRMILGMAQDSKPSADIKSELSESLKWQELIHTSYFDVPEFVDLLALRLHRAGLGDLKQGFTLDAVARDALDAWCDGKAG